MAATWQHKGIYINIDQHGRFLATYEDIQVNEASLYAARAKIDTLAKNGAKRELSLAVLTVHKGKVIESVLLGVNRTSSTYMLANKSIDPSNNRIVPNTPANRAIMDRYAKAQSEWNEAQKAAQAIQLINPGYGRIEVGQYDELLSRIEKDYEAKAK